MKKYRCVNVFERPFFDGEVDEAVDFISDSILLKNFLCVATPNPEQIVMAQGDQNFRNALGKFDVFLPDGQGIIWASQRFGTPLKQRVAGIEVVEKLLKKAREESWKVFVLGGEKYTQNSLDLAPQLEFEVLSVQNVQVFWAAGFDKSSSTHSKKVLDWIEKEKPELVFVALGAPYQERWIIDHKLELEKAGVRVAMVVGGAFDVLTGKIKRAPSVVRSLKLEWFWRFLQQPSRWRRQLRLLTFVRMVMRYS